MSSWDVFHSERLEVLRSLSPEEIRAALASGSLRDDDLVRPAGTKDPWARLAEVPGLLAPEPPPPLPSPPAEPGPPRDLEATLVDQRLDEVVDPSDAPTIPPWAAQAPRDEASPPAPPVVGADEFAPPSDEHGISPARPAPRVDPEPASSKFEFDHEYGPGGERLFEELGTPEAEGLASFRKWLDEEPPAAPTIEVDTPAAIAVGAEPPGGEGVAEPFDPLEEDELAADFTLIPGGQTPAEEVDLTAMVDVSFLLILFFLIAATSVFLKTLEIPDPNPENTEAAAVQPRTIEELETDFILVAIDPSGTFTVDHEPIEPTLAALVERLRNARRDSGRTGMLLTADTQAMHRHAVLAYDAANEVGLRIAIARSKGPE